jgi:hypothetical protein
MTRKNIVILACSIKSGGRCVAGKEVVEKDGFWCIGDWIRPVGKTGDGKVTLAYLNRYLGREPRLGEIISIPFDDPSPTSCQPENWLLANERWELLNQTWDWKYMPALVDHPDKVWLDVQCDGRRVRPGYVESMQKPASLYLIQPDALRAAVSTETNIFVSPPRPKYIRRAYIDYASHSHEFAIDDPLLGDRYYPNYPPVDTGPVDVPFRNVSETLVTVSLTPEFRGYHWKIGAAFFEPPADEPTV